MTTAPYIDGTGALRNRSLESGDGSIENPDVAHFALKPTQRTPGLLSTTTTGTVAAGARSVTIKNVGGAAGTVLTVSIPAGQSVDFVSTGNDTLAAIAYDGTGTTLLISEVR